MSATTLELVTISFSHYCERARWALDRSGVDFREVPALPGTQHKVWQKVLPGHGTTVPVLAFRDARGEVERAIGGSDQIIQWVASRTGGAWLYPNEESRELATFFDQELGWFTRAWFMRFWLDRPGSGARFVRDANGSPVGKQLMRIFWRLVRMKVGELNGVAFWEKARAQIDKSFARVEQLLDDGRAYLAGEQFSAADLTFAALATPVMAPPEVAEIQMAFPSDVQVSDMRRWRESVSGAFVRRVYASERGGPVRIRRS